MRSKLRKGNRMSAKEAKARIKINKLLEDAGWRFFDNEFGPANIQVEANVRISHTGWSFDWNNPSMNYLYHRTFLCPVPYVHKVGIRGKNQKFPRLRKV